MLVEEGNCQGWEDHRAHCKHDVLFHAWSWINLPVSAGGKWNPGLEQFWWFVWLIPRQCSPLLRAPGTSEFGSVLVISVPHLTLKHGPRALGQLSQLQGHSLLLQPPLSAYPLPLASVFPENKWNFTLQKFASKWQRKSLIKMPRSHFPYLLK